MPDAPLRQINPCFSRPFLAKIKTDYEQLFIHETPSMGVSTARPKNFSSLERIDGLAVETSIDGVSFNDAMITMITFSTKKD